MDEGALNRQWRRKLSALVALAETYLQCSFQFSLVSRRPILKRGSGETVYKKFGAAGMLEAPIRSLHFKLIM